MGILVAAAIVFVAQESRPALRPSDIAVGDTLEMSLESLSAAGSWLGLRISVLEKLQLRAESCDADVWIAVEDETGKELARDEDSGTETEAQLSWTPEHVGVYRIRVGAAGTRSNAKGMFAVRVLRGALASAPDPKLAAIHYWDIALERAREGGDDARAALALDRLAALEGRADASAALAARKERNAVSAEVQALLRDAGSLEARRDLDAARSKLRAALERLEADPALAGDPVLSAVAWNAGFVAYRLGDLPSARDAWVRARAHRERVLPPDHPELFAARSNLALILKRLGDLAGARALEVTVLEARERTHPEDHADLQLARQNFASTLQELGDLQGARALAAKVLEVRERTLPPDHPDLQLARQNFAIAIAGLGDLQGARVLEEKVLEVRERTLPRDHPDLLASRQNLAVTIRRLGDLLRARALDEQVLEARERTLPSDHRDLQAARMNYAGTIQELGDLEGARALVEGVVEVFERTLPADHPDLQKARANLAAVIRELGDLPGARALEEQMIDVLERTLPDDHPDLLYARANHAITLKQSGDLKGALALEEKLLEVRARTLPRDHPDLQSSRINLALTVQELGDLMRASALEHEVIEVYERTLPPEHLDLQKVRLNFAATLHERGDLAGARDLLERVLAVLERVLPDDHPDLQLARLNLARALGALGNADRLGPVLLAACRGSRRELRRASALSPREAQEAAANQADLLFTGITLGPTARDASAIARDLFAWIETRRVLAAPRSGGSEPDDAKIVELRAAVYRARQASADLVSEMESASSRPSAAAIADAAHRRDEAERALAVELAARGRAPIEVDLLAIAESLPRGSAAAGYLRYSSFTPDPARPGKGHSEMSLLAHVVREDGRMVRMELGPLAPIEAAAERWRAALDAPLATRGVSGLAMSRPVVSADAAREAGEALRRTVLDPVLAASGGARRIYVCLDGALHLVPLDALPMGKGIVGDEVAIRVETSFARLVRPTPAPASEPSILCVGGVEFGAEGAIASDRGASYAAPPIAMERGKTSSRLFAALPATDREADAIGSAFEERFGAKAQRLRGAGATKAAFHDRAPKARYLHLATHGYFSVAAVKAWGESESADLERDASVLWRRETVESRVKGLSPLALCGLAFAGANRGPDSHGRVAGILTAEELAGLDLRNAELAVLSACETNVANVPRSGLGIQSLQAALHAAGVRTAITSLWSVPDEHTRELMVDFYRRLWIEKRPVAAALWEAKKAARAKGWPIRDWAGWILTGDPGDEPARAAIPSTAPAAASRRAR